MSVMGIDPSLSSTGLIVLANGSGEVVFHTAIKSKENGPARWLEIEDSIRDIIKKLKPNLVCIEGYGFNSHSGNVQAELGGIIRRRLYKDCIYYIEVAPNQLKKFASGKGNTQKEFMPLEVHKRWGVQFPTHDETDAYVLARIAEAIELALQDESNLKRYTQFQQEIIRELSPKGKGKGKPRARSTSKTGQRGRKREG